MLFQAITFPKRQYVFLTVFLTYFPAHGLRDANAYILVFDLLCPDSFEYISGMFSQLNESRDLGQVPVVVVGNKTDKVNENIYNSRMKSRRDSEERRDFWERDSHGHNGGGHHGSMFGHDDHNGFGFGGHGGGSHGHGDHGFGHFGGGFGGHGHHDYFGSSKKKHKVIDLKSCIVEPRFRGDFGQLRFVL